MKNWKNALYAAVASMFAMTTVVVDLSALPEESMGLKAYLSNVIYSDSLIGTCVYALLFLLLLAGANRRTKSVRCALCALVMAGIHVVSGIFLNGSYQKICVVKSDNRIAGSYTTKREKCSRIHKGAGRYTQGETKTALQNALRMVAGGKQQG